MTPAAILTRVVLLGLLVWGLWWNYQQVAVVLPATQHALQEQKDKAAAAEAARDAAVKQRKALQDEQARVAEKEKTLGEERDLARSAADVAAGLLGMCEAARTALAAGAGAAAHAAGALAEADGEEADRGVGELEGLAAELREVPADDAAHRALAAEWCKLKKARGERQPGCP